MYYRYEIEQGGLGVVWAQSKEDARQQVIEAYRKHSGEDGFTEEVKIFEIDQPFDDAPDVIELLDC